MQRDNESGSEDGQVDNFENLRRPQRGGYGGGQGNGGEKKFKNEVMARSLPFKASEADLQDHFSQFGEVQSLNLLKSHDGASKGICFVRYDSEDAMKQAIDSSGSELLGRRIVVEKTRPREERDPAGFGGRNDRGDRGDRDGRGDRGDRGDRRDNYGSRGGDRGDYKDNRRERHGSRERSRERERPYDGGNGDSSSQCKTVFVGNLSFSTTEDSLRDFFETCGGIRDVRISLKPDGKSRGFAHIEFNDEKAAQKALKYNDDKLDGRRLRVDLAQGRKNRD
jgi:RNA recognition motif-containing protein